MKTSSIINLSLTLFLFLPAQAISAYEGSSYTHIKQQVFSQAYTQLPNYQVDKKLFGDSGHSDANQLRKAARRTLTLKADLFDFPHQQKLLQANGICFAGEWVIDTPSSYSGQFSHPTRTHAIARASVALSGTQQEDIRAFGMAIKLFPGNSPDQPTPTLNAFFLHSMGGVRSKYVLDLAIDNEPPLGSLPAFRQLTTAYRLLRDLKAADRMISPGKPDVSYRPVTHLAAYGEQDNVISPTWLRLTAAEALPRIDKNDFRDELRVEHYPKQKLSWVIEVASDTGRGKKPTQWQRIGKLIFDESITSPACDQRLHFSHPPLNL